jgi:hypothetical protein
MLPLHQPAGEVAVWIKKQIKLEENFVMGRTLKTVITGMGVILTTLVPYSLAQAPTLQEQLAAQYKIVRMGSDTSGYSVVEKGTLLAIQKGGILAVPYADQAVLPSKYEGGSIHGPSGVSLMGRKSIMGRFGKEQTTHLFQVGDKVYPMKIDVNVAKDTVSMSVVACDTCNKTDPPTYNKAQVVFQFPKGSLVKASAGEVEDIIGQVLSISEEEQQQGGDQGGQQQGGDQGQQGGGNQQPQPQAEPQSIEKGMTTDQVEGAMGKPEKIVNLGPKKIYVYKDLKVTFLNGKVFDVQ